MYRAKRFSDGKLYALKEADVGKMSAVERKDAVNEIRLMASIKHENVVRYNEAILDGTYLMLQAQIVHNSGFCYARQAVLMCIDMFLLRRGTPRHSHGVSVLSDLVLIACN